MQFSRTLTWIARYAPSKPWCLLFQHYVFPCIPMVSKTIFCYFSQRSAVLEDWQLMHVTCIGQTQLWGEVICLACLSLGQSIARSRLWNRSKWKALTKRHADSGAPDWSQVWIIHIQSLVEHLSTVLLYFDSLITGAQVQKHFASAGLCESFTRV